MQLIIFLLASELVNFEQVINLSGNVMTAQQRLCLYHEVALVHTLSASNRLILFVISSRFDFPSVPSLDFIVPISCLSGSVYFVAKRREGF